MGGTPNTKYYSVQYEALFYFLFFLSLFTKYQTWHHQIRRELFIVKFYHSRERVELPGCKGMWNVTLCKVKQVETLMSVLTKGVNKSFLKKKPKFREIASDEAHKLSYTLEYISLR